MEEKKKAGRIKYFMNKEEFNTVCNMMRYISEELDAGRYSAFAKYMFIKLLRYSVILGNPDADKCPIRISLYDNEAQLLLSIYTVYMHKCLEGTGRVSKDYISILKGKKGRKNDDIYTI